MKHRISALRGLILGLAALTVISSPSLAQGGDPFSPGERWDCTPAPGEAWIPSRAAFAAKGNLAWSAATGADGRLMAMDLSQQGSVTPRYLDTAVSPAAGTVEAVAGSNSDALYALAQYPAPSLYQRRTEVTAHGLAAAGTQFAPRWTHDLGLLANGPALLACDRTGDLVLAAAWDNSKGQVRIDWLNGTTGALDARLDVPGAGLDGLRVSADGKRVALAAGLALYIFDGAGTLLHQEALSAATRALSLSGDGRTVLVGGFGQLSILREENATWQFVQHLFAPPTEIATRADLSDDGGTIAIGWWNYATGTDLRFEVWDGVTFQRTHEIIQIGTPGGLQNLPEAVVVSPSGQRIACGSWGNGSSDPEVILLDRDQPQPVMEIDLNGSLRSLDLDESGTRLLVAAKDTHANNFSTTGGLRLFDTGERSLQVIEPVEVGGSLHLAAREPTALFAFFLLGDRATTPIQIAGVGGTLLLERASLFLITPRATDINGRADLSYTLGNDPALVGTQFAAQAAFRLPGALELSAEAVDPLLL
ncbi:MAG: hypothetical protein QF724_00275 [Planctomycetota bacterium]|nr:hypothetical protein [Planctomycetota bacterium]MDP6369069.1 hypothetical protein [Planctomycetota bacterium]MDP6520442.1 hypothetical protein [Planctomycetota bacterium]MDP6837353.1 hypothetical protein [Planctomycetota bacterium]MDP6955372.1 hypothetical protein [Planctomycetota bacterium]